MKHLKNVEKTKKFSFFSIYEHVSDYNLQFHLSYYGQHKDRMQLSVR